MGSIGAEANTIKTNTMTRPAWMSFVIILFIASVLRLGDAGRVTTFRYDQAQLSLLALKATSGEALPLLGIQSSAGVPNSPMTVYFLMLPFWLTHNPLIVNLFIAVWNVLGVGVFWWLVYRYFGLEVASIAGLAYAVNPFAVFYSRIIWAQDYHTPFILLALCFGFLGFREGKRWAQVLCLPIFFIGLQIHFAAWTLLPLYLWFIWGGWRNLSWRHLGLSVILALLTILPFALGLAQESGGAVARANTIASIVEDGLRFRWYPLQQVADLSTGLGIEMTARDEGTALLQTVPRWDVLWQLLGIFAVIGIAAVWLPRWRKFAIFVCLWGGITLATFIPIWTGSGVYHHYFIPTLPALALLTALGAIASGQLLVRITTQARMVYIFYVVLGAVFISQMLWTLGMYAFLLDTYNISNRSGQTSTPLSYLLDVREALQPYDDVIILGANPHESNYYIWEPMLYESASCVRDLLINGGGIDILPQGSFAVLVAPRRPINANYQVPQRYQHDNPLEIALRSGEDPYVIYAFDEAPTWTETPIVTVEAPRFENGVRLSGYYLTEEWLQLRWEVWQAEGNAYQYFAHFLDANGEKIGQRDAPFYVGQHWCEGDTLITTVQIDLPQGVEMLRVGMYTLDADGGTSNQALIDDDVANIIGTWFDIAIDSP